MAEKLQNIKSYWIFIGLGGLLLFMSLNYHAKVKPFTYQSQLWSDKAGYNVYLPYTFIYKMEPRNFIDSLDVKTGNGFSIDRENNKIHVKYTSGVAILQLPFFLIADLYAYHSDDYSEIGYSQPYQTAVDFAGVFYCVFGLYLLFQTLLIYFTKKRLILFTLFALLFGTNLLYYAIDETGMSHVYSFFLFSAFLYITLKSNFLKDDSFKWHLLLGLCFGLITLIRPTNGIIIFVFLFWKVQNIDAFKTRLLNLLPSELHRIFTLAVILVWIPQLFFWFINEGQSFYYSYGEEGFDFLHPKFWQVLFSAKQGAFVYGSILLLAFIGILRMVRNKLVNGYLYLAIFIFVAFITASWHDPEFGCSYGVRNFVEYTALFVFPLFGLFSWASEQSKPMKSAFYAVVLVLIIFNVLLVYAYGGCSFATSHWDYGAVINKALEF